MNDHYFNVDRQGQGTQNSLAAQDILFRFVSVKFGTFFLTNVGAIWKF
jgi:hypothetical protein